MKRLLTAIALLSIFACKTPDWATECAKRYPPQEKTNTVIQLVKGDDTNYKSTIDSLIAVGDFLQYRLRKDSARATDSISKACGDLVASYIAKVADLQSRIKNLKPPTPDTLKIQSEVWQKASAELDAQKQEYENKLAEQQKQLVKIYDEQKDAAVKDYKQQRNKAYILSGILSVIGIGAIVLRIKSII